MVNEQLILRILFHKIKRCCKYRNDIKNKNFKNGKNKTKQTIKTKKKKNKQTNKAKQNKQKTNAKKKFKKKKKKGTHNL